MYLHIRYIYRVIILKYKNVKNTLISSKDVLKLN